MVEYEALLLGIEIAKDMGIKLLSIKGDSDLIVQQVKNKFACKCNRLKKYRNAVWERSGLPGISLDCPKKDEECCPQKSLRMNC